MAHQNSKSIQGNPSISRAKQSEINLIKYTCKAVSYCGRNIKVLALKSLIPIKSGVNFVNKQRNEISFSILLATAMGVAGIALTLIGIVIPNPIVFGIGELLTCMFSVHLYHLSQFPTRFEPLDRKAVQLAEQKVRGERIKKILSDDEIDGIAIFKNPNAPAKSLSEKEKEFLRYVGMPESGITDFAIYRRNDPSTKAIRVMLRVYCQKHLPRINKDSVPPYPFPVVVMVPPRQDCIII